MASAGALGSDVSRLQAAVAPCRATLEAARGIGMLILHTREGHRPDLSDAPPHKVNRGDPKNRIGARGPMGRILVRANPATTSFRSSTRSPVSR